MIYIIGTGVMGSAIAKSLAEQGQRVFVYNKTYAKARKLTKGLKITADKNLEHLRQADYVILAVKPYQLADLNIEATLKPSAILVSIAAGVKIGTIQRLFAHKKVIRLMPNLGLSVGLGVAAWMASDLSAKEKIAAKKVLDKISQNFEVKTESQIDAVTAISGSGPAYFFYFAQGLEQAAINLGFNPKQAREIIEKTFLASAVLQRGSDYGDLIKRVASKKGTTEQALKVLGKNNLHKLIFKAVKAAQKRAREISNE